ncbi:UNVERIFIED_CONTAM: hypothetical protein Sradi_2897700 [Sesamum radiatum]|uniref:Uncharacterized protein n=1 Tax=Sesamum radiatum TaxID=300843 RepID=A0AAW2RY30_SESRA
MSLAPLVLSWKRGLAVGARVELEAVGVPQVPALTRSAGIEHPTNLKLANLCPCCLMFFNLGGVKIASQGF